jgi:hypothetical protein
MGDHLASLPEKARQSTLNGVKGGIMKQTTARVASIVLAGFLSLSAFAQEKTQEQKAAEAYKKMGELATEHLYLNNFVGEWTVHSKAWTAPDRAPVESELRMKSELILGERFLMMRFNGVMFGQPVEGVQITGYDTMKNQFNTLWIDNTSTAFFQTAGKRDATGFVLEEEGSWLDPVAGTPRKVRTSLRTNNSREFTYQMFMVGSDGKEFKSLENQCKKVQ